MSWNTFRSKSSRRHTSSLVVPTDPLVAFHNRISGRDAEVGRDAYCSSLVENLKVLCHASDCPVRIICYGIGSIFESPISQYQYSLLKLIRKSLDVVDSGIYDPIFNEHEKEWLTKEDFQLISFPSCGYIKKSGEQLIFFMPHCESFVYRDWLEDILRHLQADTEFLMFGNDLASYSSMKELLSKIDHSVLPIASLFAPRNDVFNDCYLQIIRIK